MPKKKLPTTKIRFSLIIPNSLNNALELLALNQHQSKNQLIGKILEDYVRENGWQVATRTHNIHLQNSLNAWAQDVEDTMLMAKAMWGKD